jgi:hypothetical protein
MASDGNGFPFDAGASDANGFLTDATVSSDGGSPSDAAQPDDVQPPTDSGASDAASALLENPSFELRENPAFGQVENQFGADVLVSELGGFVPGAGALFANIDPWFACWLGAQVESDLAGTVGGLTATQGQALITTSYGPFIFLPGLFQFLKQPLEVGRSYSFTVDVLNSGTGRAALRIGATNLACTPPEVYATTPELTNTNHWETHCLTFEATRPFDTFTLVPVELGDAGATGQVSFDNLRVVADCP